MKITSVTYRTNRPSTGNRYVHEHVEACAQIGKGETAAQALEKLKAEVHKLLYPELAGLRAQITKAAPLVAEVLSNLSDDELAKCYHENVDEFSQLLNGELAQRAFLQAIAE